MKLALEMNEMFAPTTQDLGVSIPGVTMTPSIGKKDYWLLRVKLTEKQAIIGFPKFGLIGIGFQKEEDWNTNLPYSCDAEKIYKHIRCNKGDPSIRKPKCLKAIEMIREAATIIMEKKHEERARVKDSNPT